jgi:hypothetical protein
MRNLKLKLICSALILAGVTAAGAQTTPPETPPAVPGIPEKVAPPPASADSLSEKLNKTDGVITPPPTGDAMQTPAPPRSDGATMPVIPPPGSPGVPGPTPK